MLSSILSRLQKKIYIYVYIYVYTGTGAGCYFCGSTEVQPPMHKQPEVRSEKGHFVSECRGSGAFGSGSCGISGRCRQRSAPARRHEHPETPTGWVRLPWPLGQGPRSGDAASLAPAGSSHTAPQGTRGTRYVGVCVGTSQADTRIFLTRPHGRGSWRLSRPGAPVAQGQVCVTPTHAASRLFSLQKRQGALSLRSEKQE